MTSKCRFLMFVAGLLVLPAMLSAQDSQETPIGFGGFTTQGSVSVGGRFTDVKGYEPMYLELFDLQPGVRVMDFNAFGEAKEGTNPFADSYSVSVSNLGGDPFPTAQFSVIKNNLYDLRVNWRQAYYYWNQNDNVVLPIAPVLMAPSCVALRLLRTVVLRNWKSVVGKVASCVVVRPEA